MKLRKLNKKGVLGLNTVKDVFILILIISVISVAVTLALTSLRDSGVFTTGDAEYNQTVDVVGNITAAQVDFFANTGTIYSILIVVVIILAIAIVIAVVTRFGGGRGSASL